MRSTKTLLTIGSVTADKDAATTAATAPCVVAWKTREAKETSVMDGCDLKNVVPTWAKNKKTGCRSYLGEK
jgi:hypothetical protein